MSAVRVLPCTGLQGSTTLPGDKSISHRALLLGALANGPSTINNFLPGGDCLATAGALRALGISIETPSERTVIVHGGGLNGLQPSHSPINCVRSGTTMRLLAGLLAGQSFSSILTGEEQLLRRPMERVAIPLRQMGAEIQTTNGHAPLHIQGRRLHGTQLTLEVPSAQVKSAILLAALYADSPTTIHETAPTRDHTERMLQAMGAVLEVHTSNKYRKMTLFPHRHPLTPLEIEVPGDFSSAAFPLVAALIIPGSHIHLKNIGINPTRTGLLDALIQMGASVRIHNERLVANEPAADLEVQSSQLKAIEIAGDLVVRMIDEFPIFAIAATQAQGKTVVRDAAELRVKETDRIATVVTELRKLGAVIVERLDGFEITGPVKLQGAAVSSHGDHRLAMALFVAGLTARAPIFIDDVACAADSFPGFLEIMQSLGAEYASN